MIIDLPMLINILTLIVLTGTGIVVWIYTKATKDLAKTIKQQVKETINLNKYYLTPVVNHSLEIINVPEDQLNFDFKVELFNKSKFEIKIRVFIEFNLDLKKADGNLASLISDDVIPLDDFSTGESIVFLEPDSQRNIILTIDIPKVKKHIMLTPIADKSPNIIMTFRHESTSVYNVLYKSFKHKYRIDLDTRIIRSKAIYEDS